MTYTVVFARQAPLDPVTVEVYGGLANADAYLYASSIASKYRLGSDDARKRWLVEATRYIDAQEWDGTANGVDGTTLAFPRDGLPDDPGNAEQLALVERAAFELAALIATNPALVGAADQSSNIKSLKGGPAEIEFFGPTSVADGDATVLPVPIHRLLGKWLAGGGSTETYIAGGESGTSCESSQFSDSNWRRGR